MDGNRRWARKHCLPAPSGHKEGLARIDNVIDFCIEQRIEHLSLYTLSLENLAERSSYELSVLFSIIEQESVRFLAESKKKNIRISFVGKRDSFPPSLVPIIINLEQETAYNTDLHVYLFFCYGSRQEIISAVKQLASQIKSGTVNQPEITIKLFEEQLWTSGIPEPDVIVRTGGAHRLSNFMLYQAAYAEFYFIDCLWPDITKEYLHQALSFFTGCKRNFGT